MGSGHGSGSSIVQPRGMWGVVNVRKAVLALSETNHGGDLGNEGLQRKATLLLKWAGYSTILPRWEWKAARFFHCSTVAEGMAVRVLRIVKHLGFFKAFRRL